jgi:hypothetical protein
VKAIGSNVTGVQGDIAKPADMAQQLLPGQATSADAPIPIWALGALGMGLFGIASRRLKRGS